mgnify:CR=1 FL=1
MKNTENWDNSDFIKKYLNYNLWVGFMMKNIANYISISRIVMSILLLLTKTLTIPFIIIYLYCGVSDMVDGYIARKCNNTSEIGSMLDSIADIIFVIISIFKIVPFLNLPNVIIIWAIIIALIIEIFFIYNPFFYKDEKSCSIAFSLLGIIGIISIL